MASGKLIILQTQGLTNHRLQGLQDIKSLQDAFKMYKCDDFDVYNISTKSDLENIVQGIRKGNICSFKYIIVAILSSDNFNNRIRLSDKQFVNLETEVILPISNIPCLATKPKLFIMEASRSEFDLLSAQSDAVPFSIKRTPGNLLRCYATKEGFEIRPTNNGGSAYTETFCELLKEKGSTISIQEIHRLTSASLEKKETFNKDHVWKII